MLHAQSRQTTGITTFLFILQYILGVYILSSKDGGTFPPFILPEGWHGAYTLMRSLHVGLMCPANEGRIKLGTLGHPAGISAIGQENREISRAMNSLALKRGISPAANRKEGELERSADVHVPYTLVLLVVRRSCCAWSATRPPFSTGGQVSHHILAANNAHTYHLMIHM